MINDAIPGVIPTCIPKKANENCKANIIRPYNTTILNGIAGGLIKKMAGILDNMNRKAQSNIGGISSRPSLTKRKLMPQIITTNKANKTCAMGIEAIQ